MFDIGFSELLVIAVVALLVLGPERLPKAARFTGLWVRKARAQWYAVKTEFEREMAADELTRSLAAPVAELRREVADAGQALSDAARDAELLARADAEAAAAVHAPAAVGAAGPASDGAARQTDADVGVDADADASPAPTRSDPPPP
ncbi:MAG: twin-arginine translocase subunit TatB [Arenimonas sp.]|nr:twin-arginine translocase subunit TatB [Arenimonas sp.]